MASTRDEIAYWRNEISLSNSFMEGKILQWKTALQVFRGLLNDADIGYGAGHKSMEQSLAYAQQMVKRIVPRLYYRDPHITVRPRWSDPLIDASAKAISAILGVEFDRLRVGVETRKCIMDAFLYNRAYMKYGYTADVGSVEDMKDSLGAVPPALPQRYSPSERNVILAKHKRIKATDLSHDSRMVSGELFAMRVHPKFIRVDPYATCMEDARWIAIIYPRKVSEVEGSKLYNMKHHNPDTEGLGLSGMMAWTESSSRDDLGISRSDAYTNYHDSELVYLIEVWDRTSGGVFVLTEHTQEGWLREPRRWPYQQNEWPLASLQMNEDPESFWGKSEVENWIPTIVELDSYRRKRIVKIKQHVTKWLIDAEALDPNEADKFASDIEGELIKVGTENRSLDQVVRRNEPSPISNDLFSAEARAKEEYSNVTGQSQQRRGTQGTYMTATEVATVEGAARDNEADNLRAIAEFQSTVARGLLSLTRQFKSMRELVQEVGAVGFDFQRGGVYLTKHPYDVHILVGASAYVPPGEMLNRMERFVNLAAATGFLDAPGMLEDMAEELQLSRFGKYILNPNDPRDQQKLSFLTAARNILGIAPFQVPGTGQGGVGSQPANNNNSLARMAAGGEAGANLTNSGGAIAAQEGAQGG